MATLRADLYAAWLALPALKALKDAGATLDLAPPGAAELAEIVRAPAAAADLAFETDPASGERLDEILLREADRPDMLPLVELALSRLWEARETRGAETVLPLAAFRRLGGVRGIIEEAGEAAVQGGEAAGRLPPLIRRLGELSPDRAGTPGAVTTRAVPLAEAAPDPQSRILVDALVAARLLTLSDEAGTTTVRLAHQRVLSDWARTAAIVADSAAFYRVRDAVEAQRRRWQEAGRRRDLLLPRGLPLAEARAMATAYGAELPPGTLAYVAASRRRANRAQAVAWSAAAVFALVAIGAGIAGRLAIDEKRTADGARREAEAQRAEAEQNLGIADSALDGLVYDITDGLRGSGTEVPIATRRKILDTALQTLARLQAKAPRNDDLQLRRSVILSNLAVADLDAGDLAAASAPAEQSLQTMRALVAEAPGDDNRLHDLSVALVFVAEIKKRAGDFAGAAAAYDESVAIARGLLDRHPDNAYSVQALEASLEGLGDARLRAGDASGALSALREGLPLIRDLVAHDPRNPKPLRELVLCLDRVGGVEVRSGDVPAALATYRESLEVRRRLAAQTPEDAGLERDLAAGLAQVGDLALRSGDAVGALAADRERLDIRRALAAKEPGNPRARTDLATALGATAYVALFARDDQQALGLCDEAVAIRPDIAWLDRIRADALMLVGRGDEARDLFLEPPGSGADDVPAWRRAVAADFAALRKAGITDPLMDEIEKRFAAALPEKPP